MEPDILNVETTALGMAVLAAIPVVIFALWAEYFGQSLEDLKNDKTHEFNPAGECEKSRMAVLFVILFELILYLGSPEVREAYPFLSQLEFVATTVTLLLIGSSLEKKIQPPAHLDDDVIKIILKTSLFWILGSFCYVSLLFVFVQAALWIGHRNHLPATALSGLLLLGGFLGVILGISLNYAFSPFLLKKLLPTRPLQSKPLEAELVRCFHQAGLKPVEFWTIKLYKLKLISVMITGFPHGRGIFRQNLFISHWVIDRLSYPEISALVLNQISHRVLKNMRKRLFLTFSLILITTLLAGIAVFIQVDLDFIAPALALVSFFVSFKALTRQAKNHQLNADHYCIHQLGVSPQDLISSLRKVDLVPHPDPNFPPTVHPDTEMRIRMLQDLISDAERKSDKNSISKAS